MQYDEMLEIKARDNSRCAVEFKGELTDALRELLSEFDMTLMGIKDKPRSKELFYIEDNNDLTAISIGDYFVSYGPYWDVLSPLDFHEDFEVE